MDLANLTPMLRQYYDLKRQCGDAVLFFRMGDFYEMFGSDAEQVAPELELVLTSRERGDQQKIPFCGVPHHSAKAYWLKLLKAGYRVAIADQMEDPAEAKGLVRREITRIMTPGAIDDPEGLDRDAPNYLMAVYQDPSSGQWAMALADLSTGELRLGSVAGESEILASVEHFRPKEILARAFCRSMLEEVLAPYRNETKLLIDSLPEAILRDEGGQREILKSVLGGDDLRRQPSGDLVGGRELLAGLLTHLKGLQASLAQFLSVRPLREPRTMIIDETVRRDLELFESSRRREAEGSLFRQINRTLSPMGARALRYALAHPLVDRDEITARHECVAALRVMGQERLRETRSSLKNAPDLERLATRVVSRAAQPHELGMVRSSLMVARELGVALSGEIRAAREGGRTRAGEAFESIVKGLGSFERPLAILGDRLAEIPESLGSGQVFRAGFDARLDELVALSRDGEARLQAYETRLREETGIGSLKVKNHKAFGLLIEITKSNLGKVPASFIRRQTMVNGERFVTVELRELGEALASATDMAVQREMELFGALLGDLAEFRADLQAVGRAVAWFDVLQSMAWVAIEGDYCAPIMSTNGTLRLMGARHPVVEHFTGRHAFVPNDVVMESDGRHLLVTGPNMAGKSTVLRQTALCAILCQMGSFVPAVSAELPVFDRVFTRVGAADDLARGQSTFMVEMSEAADILRQATDRSLVILDEVGRGTSTADGLAIASAIMEWLATRLKSYTLFATHYHEMVPMATTLPGVRVVQTEVIEKDGRVTFTHRLVNGASGSSFGIEVARIAGLPEPVLRRAREFLAVESGRTPSASVKESAPVVESASVALEAKGLVVRRGEDDPNVREIVRRLEGVKIHRTTPLQALNMLNDLKSLIGAGEQKTLF